VTCTSPGARIVPSVIETFDAKHEHAFDGFGKQAQVPLLPRGEGDEDAVGSGGCQGDHHHMIEEPEGEQAAPKEAGQGQQSSCVRARNQSDRIVEQASSEMRESCGSAAAGRGVDAG
jgi:hypothetical protein